MMKYLLFSALLLCFTPLHAQDSLQQDRALSLLTTLHDTIVYRHPVGQTTEGRAELATAYGKARRELQIHVDAPSDSVAIQDFIVAAGALQQASGCGHMMLTPKRGKDWVKRRRARQSFGVVQVADGAYLANGPIGLLGGDTLRPGTVVASIGGRPVADVIGHLAVFQGVNDAGSTVGPRYRVARYLSGMYEARYGLTDSLKIGYRDTLTGAILNAYAAMAPPTPSTQPRDTKAPERTAKRERKRMLHDTYFNLRLADDSSAWILSIRSFSDGNYKYRSFRRSVKKAFATINSGGPDKLVLDMRLNGGGNIMNARLLCEYLAREPFAMADDAYSTVPNANGKGIFQKAGMYLVGGVRKRDGIFRMKEKTEIIPPRDDAFDGAVVVLIHELSFSATTLAANVLQQTGSATLIGGPTGGGRAATYGGLIKELTIGDEAGVQFELNMPNWVFVPFRAAPGNVLPDRIIPLTAANIRAERDGHLEEALEILRGK